MKEYILITTLLTPIVAFLIAGALSIKGSIRKQVIKLTSYISYSSIIASVIATYWLTTKGNFQTSTLGINELGLSFKLDPLSLIMFSMISIIGLIVIKFSYNYLQGDQNHFKFIGQLSITIASVQILVLSGNLLLFFLAWVATSVSLNKLLLFYNTRKHAALAAKKKFLVTRLADASLLIAFMLIYLEFETGDLNLIFTKIIEIQSASPLIETALLFLVFCAAFKSAQLPFHGWLLEVMEAPTPVSALLHAGILNAGPFLMIRFSYLLEVGYYAPILLLTIGAITAIYGAIVFTTQPTIKTALAYSSVGHMGFTLMTCGLGLYSAALLHLVSHSFYKAHSFLSSGSLIEKVKTNQNYNFKRTGNIGKIGIGLIIATASYLTVAKLWGVSINTEAQLLVIGGIIYLGTITLFVNSIDSTSSHLSTARVFITAIIVLNVFFGLEGLMSVYLGTVIPEIGTPNNATLLISLLTLLAFSIVILIQNFSPLFKSKNAYRNLGIHMRNGFYLNVVLNRIMKSLQHKN